MYICGKFHGINLYLPLRTEESTCIFGLECFEANQWALDQTLRNTALGESELGCVYPAFPTTCTPGYSYAAPQSQVSLCPIPHIHQAAPILGFRNLKRTFIMPCWGKCIFSLQQSAPFQQLLFMLSHDLAKWCVHFLVYIIFMIPG